MTDRADLKKAAEHGPRLFAECAILPAVPHMLLALDYWLEEPAG